MFNVSAVLDAYGELNDVLNTHDFWSAQSEGAVREAFDQVWGVFESDRVTDILHDINEEFSDRKRSLFGDLASQNCEIIYTSDCHEFYEQFPEVCEEAFLDYGHDADHLFREGGLPAIIATAANAGLHTQVWKDVDEILEQIDEIIKRILDLSADLGL